MKARPSLSTAGSRKVSPALHQAQQIALKYSEIEPVSKQTAVTVAKMAATPLGLTSAEKDVLSILFARSKPIDWAGPTTPPIVWPSNREICIETGLSLATVKRCLRRLAERGLIAFCDSADGKRHGHRCPDTNRILRAYGINLAPIAVRLTELKELHRAANEEKVFGNQYRREITRARRSIRMTIDAALEYQLEGSWIEFLESLSLITDGMKTASMDLTELEEIRTALVSPKERVDNAFLRASNQENMNRKEAQNEPRITNYNRASSFRTSSELQRVANAPQHQDSSAFGANGFSRKPVSGFAGSQPLSPSRPAQPEGSGSSSDSEFSLGLVMTACPRMKGFAPGIGGWADLVEAADFACHDLGINQSAWIEAREAMGDIAAATAVALILEKRMAQECGSPGGYLRAMTSRARKGELHLARSLFGLAERNAAARAH